MVVVRGGGGEVEMISFSRSSSVMTLLPGGTEGRGEATT